MGKDGFRGLRVWAESKELVIQVYGITEEGKFAKDFALRDQIRRSAISIPSNIAEGDSLGTNRQSVRHFLIAKGSIAELITQAEIAYEIGYIDLTTRNQIEYRCTDIMKKLQKLISIRIKVPFSTPKTQHPIPNTQDPTPKTQHPTPNTQDPIPKTQYPRPNT